MKTAKMIHVAPMVALQSYG